MEKGGDAMLIETVRWQQINELGSRAMGTIEPANRELSIETLEHMCSDIINDSRFYIPTTAVVPAACVDGRSCSEAATLTPNLAGGTTSLMVADVLSTCRFYHTGDTAMAHLARVTANLKEQGYAVGDHRDTHASGENSGCGACDHMPRIFAFIAANSDYLQATAANYGIQVSEQSHSTIKQSIQLVLNSSYFVSGNELVAVYEQQGAQKSQLLQGSHNEVAMVLNTQQGTTLDRAALAAEYGNDYQVFNADVWALFPAATVISRTEAERDTKIAAMAYYNLATAHVLAGPTLKVLTR